MSEDIELKWVWNVPELRKVKQPDTLTPDEFVDLAKRINKERKGALICVRNQTMLWMTYSSCFKAVSYCLRHK